VVGLRRVAGEALLHRVLYDGLRGALFIAEFARRHMERGGTWGRIVGLTSGVPLGFPGEVSYGAARAALQSYTLPDRLRVGGERGSSR